MKFFTQHKKEANTFFTNTFHGKTITYSLVKHSTSQFFSMLSFSVHLMCT